MEHQETKSPDAAVTLPSEDTAQDQAATREAGRASKVAAAEAMQSPSASQPGEANPDQASSGGSEASETGASETGASEAGASEAGASEAGASEAGASEAGASETGASEAGASEAGAGGPGKSEAASADGEAGGKKRKRRRRRKRGDKKSEPGSGTQAAAGHSTASGETKSPSHAPFVDFIQSIHGHHHVFAAGEVVAGRVIGPGPDTTLLVDLFGKATAVMDLREPPEVQPDPSPSSDSPAAAAADEATSDSANEAKPEETAAVAAAGSDEQPEVVNAGAEVDSGSESNTAALASTSEVGPPTGMQAETSAIQGAVEATATSAEPGADEVETGSVTEPVAAKPESATPVELPPDPDETLGEVREVNPGAIVRGRVGAVSESGHVGIVNRYIDRAAAKTLIRAAAADRQRVSGFVFGFNRGGFDVIVKGIRVFCPASGMSLSPITDPSSYLGRRFEFLVPPKKGRGGSIVVSRRSILEREQKKARKARLRDLSADTVLSGTVTQVREFGVFVDIGDGVEGLVHQSELSWNRSARPSDLVKPGDVIDVKVLRVVTDAGKESRSEDDRESATGPTATGLTAAGGTEVTGPKGASDAASGSAEASAKGAASKGRESKRKKEKQVRISLSIKALLPDPWSEHEELLKVGRCHKGRVVRTTEFGAFIELAPSIEGLLHISELGKNLKHAKHALSEGDKVDVVVERVDRGQRRISLSKLTAAELKALEEGTLNLENRPRSTKPGTHVKVIVDRVEHAGVSVNLEGIVGRRARGFIPNRELGSYSSGDKRRSLASGLALEAKVVGNDRDGGLKLSIKGRESDEERKAVREYRKETAQQGLGTFGDLLRAKLGDGSSGG